MKPAIYALMLVASAATAHVVEPLDLLPPAIKPLRTAALAGDRQAMKNLGYTYASGGFEMKGRKLSVAGCAWFLAIPWTHATTFQNVDTMNIHVYCNPLRMEELEAAYRHAASLVAQINQQREKAPPQPFKQNKQQAPWASK